MLFRGGTAGGRKWLSLLSVEVEADPSDFIETRGGLRGGRAGADSARSRIPPPPLSFETLSLGGNTGIGTTLFGSSSMGVIPGTAWIIGSCLKDCFGGGGTIGSRGSRDDCWWSGCGFTGCLGRMGGGGSNGGVSSSSTPPITLSSSLLSLFV